MCPVVVTLYNVSPYMCLKDTNYMLSLLIPGPKAPTNDSYVYLQPLVDELIDLWDTGALTCDASKKEKFKMHIVFLWTINVLFSYANLSSCATYDNLACPMCKMETHYCINHHLMGNKSPILLQKDYLAQMYYNSWKILKKYHSGRRNQYVRYKWNLLRATRRRKVCYFSTTLVERFVTTT